MALFVKLNAEYNTDDEFIEVGPMAELLYIRALAFCKRKMLDGTISTGQLISVALGIPAPAKHAASLVRVGLWEATADGWTVTGWAKWNKSAAEITDEQESRRRASMEANHAQHHVGPGKKKSPKCELCRAEHAPKSAPKSETTRTRGRLQEPEPEPEPEPETPSSSSSVSTPYTPTPTTTDRRITEAINRHATEQATGKHNPNGYAARVRANDLYEHGTRLARYLTTHPDATTDDVLEVLTRDPAHLPPVTSPQAAAWYADPNCEHCNGDGITNRAPEGWPATYAPCPCRAPNPYPDKLATVTHLEPRTA